MEPISCVYTVWINRVVPSGHEYQGQCNVKHFTQFVLRWSTPFHSRFIIVPTASHIKFAVLVLLHFLNKMPGIKNFF
jgi:hypothetical protein